MVPQEDMMEAAGAKVRLRVKKLNWTPLGNLRGPCAYVAYVGIGLRYTVIQQYCGQRESFWYLTLPGQSEAISITFDTAEQAMALALAHAQYLIDEKDITCHPTVSSFWEKLLERTGDWPPLKRSTNSSM